jgi:hypothetical protein
MSTSYTRRPAIMTSLKYHKHRSKKKDQRNKNQKQYFFCELDKSLIITKLVSRTPKDIDLREVPSAILAPTYPAPALATLSTCNMIAPIDLLRAKAALGALYHIVLGHIFTEFCIADVLAGDSGMVYGTALEAHHLSTGAGCC